MEQLISTELNKITSKIIAINPSSLIFQAWQNFSRNYRAIFELAYEDTFISQFGQTFRYLMECVADIYIIEKYSLYNDIKSYLEKVDTEQLNVKNGNKDILKTIASFDVGEAAKSKGWKPPKGKTGTSARIKSVFEENSEAIYSFYSDFTHFNIVGLVWSNKQGDYNQKYFSIGLIQSTVMFEVMVQTIGEAIGNEELKQYSKEALQSEIRKRISSQAEK